MRGKTVVAAIAALNKANRGKPEMSTLPGRELKIAADFHRLVNEIAMTIKHAFGGPVLPVVKIQAAGIFVADLRIGKRMSDSSRETNRWMANPASDSRRRN